MYFNHIHPPLPPSVSPSAPTLPRSLFTSFSVINKSLSPVSATYIHTDMGHPLELGQSTNSQVSKESDCLFLSSCQLPVTPPPRGERGFRPLSQAGKNYVWLGLVQVKNSGYVIKT